MSHVVRVSDLSADDADALSSCEECRFTGTGHVALCGWHENVLVAFMVVEATAGTIVEDTDG
jgi:hypothetical protein